VVHVDAHADMNDHMFGEPVTHGTIFRRAIEEGLIEPSAMVQIGLRATGYAADDFDWARRSTECAWCRPRTAGIAPWSPSWPRCVSRSAPSAPST
jgi:arginase family enzyme